MNKTILILCSIAVGCLTVAAQDRPSFTVGTAKAARGQKASGVIEVPAAAMPL